MADGSTDPRSQDDRADLRDSGVAIKQVCVQFIELCRQMGLLATSSVAIDGSKFKAVNNRDRTARNKVERAPDTVGGERGALSRVRLDTADRQEAIGGSTAAKAERLKEKLVKLEGEMRRLAVWKKMMAAPDQQISITDPDSRSMATSGRGSGVVGYNVQVAVDTEHPSGHHP